MKNSQKELNWYSYRKETYSSKYWIQAETKRKAKTALRKRYGLSVLTDEIKSEATWTIQASTT